MSAALQQTLQRDDYDEFSLLADNAAEWEIPFEKPPVVSRQSFTLPSGQTLSYLQWGTGEPKLVLLHGDAQNAHSWDSVLLALGCPALAVDLPGHGHSDHRADHDYRPSCNAEALAALLEVRAQSAPCVVGIALGGLTVIHLAAEHPELCSRAVLVNATPGVNDPTRPPSLTERGAVGLLKGPATYDNFEEMVGAVVPLTTFRSVGNLRRAVRHNARLLPDGRWTWRFDTAVPFGGGTARWSCTADPVPPWDELGRIEVPTLLVLGEDCSYVDPD
ncbi:MAG TPA: alpha/beta hydrolase, partial [Acidimicrobiales bacterium]|nr:alpha/beta hydrolase [Acidimicrobiales bacterium]